MNRNRTDGLGRSRALAVVAGFGALCVATLASAATITVNSLADDVFVNVSGATFSDAAYTMPVSPTYCTLRMALAAANLNVAVGACAAGSGTDTINITPTGTILLSQVPMEIVGAVAGTKTWLLYSTGNVVINGPGIDRLTINGGGLSAGAVGLRALVVSDNAAMTDAPATISNLSFREGRSVGSIAATGGSAGGCLFSRESLTLSSVAFVDCEAAGVGNGGSNFATVGGAFAGGAAAATDVLPNFTFTDVRFSGNRTVHGTAASGFTSAAGAAALGGGPALFIGNVTLENVEFSGNSAESVGALRIANGNNATLKNVKFVSNLASTGTDGAFLIADMKGSVTLTGGGALGNSAQRRGAGQIATVGAAVSSGPAVQVSDWSFVGNAARSQDIGGLSIMTDTFDGSGNCTFTQLREVRLTNVSFEGNTASQSRGGMRIGCSADVTLTDVDFLSNEVSGNATPSSGGNSAGAIHDVANLTMTNVRIVGNRTYAGATAGGYGVFTVVGGPSASVFPSVWPLPHSLTATGLLIKDNWAEKNEGGMTLRPNGAGRNYVVRGAAVVGNRAQGLPGLFLDATGNYVVANSTFSGNQATAGMGALAVNAHAASGTNAVSIVNVTSARNGATTDPIGVNAWDPNGGPTPAPAANIAIRNTIFGTFQPGNGAPGYFPAMSGVTYTVANSLIEGYYAPNMPSGICGVNGVWCNVDARLEGLAGNGGATPTHALRPGSPALDAGDNATATAFGLTTDQRGSGFVRVINGTVDIGAFESPLLAGVFPCKLDMDGDNQVHANKEGLVLLRAMLGFTGAAVVNGTGISQGQWDAARNNLNANCGTSFAP